MSVAAKQFATCSVPPVVTRPSGGGEITAERVCTYTMHVCTKGAHAATTSADDDMPSPGQGWLDTVRGAASSPWLDTAFSTLSHTSGRQDDKSPEAASSPPPISCLARSFIAATHLTAALYSPIPSRNGAECTQDRDGSDPTISLYALSFCLHFAFPPWHTPNDGRGSGPALSRRGWTLSRRPAPAATREYIGLAGMEAAWKHTE